MDVEQTFTTSVVLAKTIEHLDWLTAEGQNERPSSAGKSRLG